MIQTAMGIATRYANIVIALRNKPALKPATTAMTSAR